MTPEPTVTPEPTSAPDTEALVLESSVSSWGGGYTVTMCIKNTSDKEVTDWELRVNKEDFDITNIWCASVTEEADELVIKPMEWNTTIATGASVTFGFQGTGEIVDDFAYTLK